MKLLKNNWITIILVVGMLFGMYEGFKYESLAQDELYNQYVECSVKPISAHQFMRLDMTDRLLMINQNCNFKHKQEYSNDY